MNGYWHVNNPIFLQADRSEKETNTDGLTAEKFANGHSIVTALDRATKEVYADDERIEEKFHEEGWYEAGMEACRKDEADMEACRKAGFAYLPCGRLPQVNGEAIQCGEYFRRI